MKRIQMWLAWFLAFLLVSANMGLEGCSTKDSAPAPVVQHDPASAPAATATNASLATSTAPIQQPGQSQPQQPEQQQLPEVNLTADGLDELMAPIALYPDPVLAVMMQAAIDPQEVMDGGNWLALDQNQNLKEAALDQASEKAGFTPVVQALLHYPTVVDMMCTQFDWTKQLGAAYQANPKAVLASVQRLRAQAVDNGALKSSSQMKVDVTQDSGQQVVELKPTDPKVVYVPQYNPDQVFQTTTTTTKPDGTVITTTTGPASTAPATTTSTNTTTVVKEKEGVSTGTAVLIGLLSFGAGIAVGSAINNNNYYYPAWGYGGVYYGPRPYYPPPYRPVYYPGYGGGYHYNRPVHYGNNNIYINNNNYYNRFNNNNNLNPNYKPKPVPYNNRPGSTYSRNMGSQPGQRQGANYRPNNPNVSNRPANGSIQARPAINNPAQRPATGNNPNNNWKGQTTYQGNKAGNKANVQPRPGTQPGNAGTNNRAGAGNAPNRNPSGDRGFPQSGGARPSTGNMQANRANTGNAQRPANANQPATRPAQTQNRPQPNQPEARPVQQPQARPQPSTTGGAFNGASNAKADRAAANRGKTSMGAPAGHAAQPKGAGGARKR
jgi:hypothetical protein